MNYVLLFQHSSKIRCECFCFFLKKCWYFFVYLLMKSYTVGTHMNHLDKLVLMSNTTGPSCSKLTMSLVNDSLKFTSECYKYAVIFCWKNVSSSCSAKATHIFSAKMIRLLYIESAKTVNEMTINELVKLTTLWTTGPRRFCQKNKNWWWVQIK